MKSLEKLIEAMNSNKVNLAAMQQRKLADGSFEARCIHLYGDAIGKGDTIEDAIEDLHKQPTISR